MSVPSLPSSLATGLALLAAALLVPACAGLKSDRTIASERAASYVAAHPNLDAKTAKAIRSNLIHEGMTMEQVVAAWGRPAEVQKFRGGKVQHWFFGCDWPHFCKTQVNRRFEDPNQKYLSNAIFEDGIVVKWER